MPLLSRALLVAPTAPATRGNGLAQRAGALLTALEQLHERVDLLIVPLSASSIASACSRLSPARGRETWLDLSSLPRGLAAVAEFSAAVAGAPIDTLTVLRSYLVPYLEPLLRSRAFEGAVRLLDLDDDEVVTRERIARRLEARSRGQEAADERREAVRVGRLEERWLEAFDGLAVASSEHAERLLERVQDRVVEVLPNVVRASPGTVVGRYPRHEAATLLLVGNLSYYPNEDAALFLAEEIWPALRVRWPAVRVVLAGAGPGPSVAALGRLESWQLVADPATLDELYAEADVAVVPVLAGGGTRIKLLEAMSHGVPVVSTAIGAEGLEVEHGRHLLIADSASEFVEHCVLLLADAGLRRRLSSAAVEWVAERHSPEQSRQALLRLRRRAALGPRRAGTPS